MLTFAIVIVIFLLIVAVVGIVAYTLLKKTGALTGDKTEDPNIKETQEFLPFEDIREDMIVLPNNKFRAIIKCSSTNYWLKTKGEQDQIELSFQNFLNTINFPITIFLQTKVIDNTARFEKLKEDCSKSVKDFPGLIDYATEYQREMLKLNETLGNTHEKNRFIIVTYDDANELSELNDDEKFVHARKELNQRCQLIRNALDGVGISCVKLTTAEIIELIYSSFYREDYLYSQVIADKECFGLFVEGEEDKFADLPKAHMLDLILSETLNKLSLESMETIPSGKMIIDTIRDLRSTYAGRYDEITMEDLKTVSKGLKVKPEEVKQAAEALGVK